METIVLILAIMIAVFAALSFIFRKPGPQGEKGDKGDRGDRGRDGFMCDDLTIERIITLLNTCEEIDLSGTTIKVKELRKMKKGA